MQKSIPENGKLVLRFGGRDVTEATWITVCQVCKSFLFFTSQPPSFPSSSRQRIHTQTSTHKYNSAED